MADQPSEIFKSEAAIDIGLFFQKMVDGVRYLYSEKDKMWIRISPMEIYAFWLESDDSGEYLVIGQDILMAKYRGRGSTIKEILQSLSGDSSIQIVEKASGIIKSDALWRLFWPPRDGGG